MRYYDLCDDVHVPQRWYLGSVIAGNDDPPMDFWEGKPMQLSTVLVAEISRPGRPLDFCRTSFATPIATKKLASAIESIAGSDVQRLPVFIEGHEGFEIVNSVRVIMCLDEERSKFMKWTEKDHRADLAGQYRSVPVLRVRSAEIPKDAHFFRVKNWEIALIVSETVKIAMENAGCLGAKFKEVT